MPTKTNTKSSQPRDQIKAPKCPVTVILLCRRRQRAL